MQLKLPKNKRCQQHPRLQPEPSLRGRFWKEMSKLQFTTLTFFWPTLFAVFEFQVWGKCRGGDGGCAGNCRALCFHCLECVEDTKGPQSSINCVERSIEECAKFKKRKIITAREVWIHLFEVKQVCETQCLYVIKLLRSWRKIIEFEMDPIQFIECCNVFDVLIMSRSLAVWWFCIWSSWNCFSGEIRYICEVWNLEALGGIASFRNQLNYFHLPKTFIEVLFKKQSKYFPTSQTLITKRIIRL